MRELCILPSARRCSKGVLGGFPSPSPALRAQTPRRGGGCGLVGISACQSWVRVVAFLLHTASTPRVPSSPPELGGAGSRPWGCSEATADPRPQSTKLQVPLPHSTGPSGVFRSSSNAAAQPGAGRTQRVPGSVPGPGCPWSIPVACGAALAGARLPSRSLPMPHALSAGTEHRPESGWGCHGFRSGGLWSLRERGAHRRCVQEKQTLGFRLSWALGPVSSGPLRWAAAATRVGAMPQVTCSPQGVPHLASRLQQLVAHLAGTAWAGSTAAAQQRDERRLRAQLPGSAARALPCHITLHCTLLLIVSQE